MYTRIGTSLHTYISTCMHTCIQRLLVFLLPDHFARCPGSIRRRAQGSRIIRWRAQKATFSRRTVGTPSSALVSLSLAMVPRSCFCLLAAASFSRAEHRDGSTRFLLALTIFLQLVFCYMVATSFTENPYDASSQNALSYWRIDMAHKASEVSQNSLTSLAARACGFDKALANSFSEKARRSSAVSRGFCGGCFL